MHPYKSLPDRAFWARGVAAEHPLAPRDIYQPKFRLKPTDKIATAGSCFAQHVGRQLRSRNFPVLDYEPAPPGLGARANKYGYEMFSARYGNVYTSRQLLQLVGEAFGERTVKNWIWTRDGRYFDAFRPAIEPNGLSSDTEVRAHRKQHLEAVRQVLLDMDVFVFTLGLTETWAIGDVVFPLAPGVVADGPKAKFLNLSHSDVLADMQAVLGLLDRVREGRPLRVLLTVSPVPLAATASGQHVLAATTYSKAVLRSVAGELSLGANIDYFPSYELVSSHWSRGVFFDADLRNVNAAGVGVVMSAFFAAHAAPKPLPGLLDLAGAPSGDVQCEEALLARFGK
ncbi:GSCFA domain-containing protein [Brevundimonas sp.]|uniref:GSCFA domain-containing protein n=1 Tax=Brevundimonas sp. TaxID=1871086 RepID=UPI0035B278C3